MIGRACCEPGRTAAPRRGARLVRRDASRSTGDRACWRSSFEGAGTRSTRRPAFGTGSGARPGGGTRGHCGASRADHARALRLAGPTPRRPRGVRRSSPTSFPCPRREQGSIGMGLVPCVLPPGNVCSRSSVESSRLLASRGPAVRGARRARTSRRGPFRRLRQRSGASATRRARVDGRLWPGLGLGYASNRAHDTALPPTKRVPATP